MMNLDKKKLRLGYLIGVWLGMFCLGCTNNSPELLALYDIERHKGEMYETSLYLTIHGPHQERVACAKHVQLTYQGSMRWSALTSQQDFSHCATLPFWIGFRGFHVNKVPGQAARYSPAGAVVVLNDGQQICPMGWSKHVSSAWIWCYPLLNELSGWHVQISTTQDNVDHTPSLRALESES